MEGKPSFITACLDGSIAASGLRRIREYRNELGLKARPESMSEAEWELRKHKLVFKFVDSLLDNEPQARHLADDRLAQTVQNAFLHFAEKRYHLYAFVVMPSHHHWLFLPKADWTEEFAISQTGKKNVRTPRESISHSIQSYTGNQCNRFLEKEGAFWQTETFDHFARDEAEMHRIIQYIERNPVVAGLVSRAEDFRWSSAQLRRNLGLPCGEAIPQNVLGLHDIWNTGTQAHPDSSQSHPDGSQAGSLCHVESEQDQSC